MLVLAFVPVVNTQNRLKKTDSARGFRSFSLIIHQLALFLVYNKVEQEGGRVWQSRALPMMAREDVGGKGERGREGEEEEERRWGHKQAYLQ